MEIASLGLRIDSQDVDKGTRSLERFERQSKRTEDAAVRLGQMATRAVAGFVAIGVASLGFSTATDRAREFNAAIAEVSTLLPAVPSEIDAITASSRALVEQYGGSATAQAKAFYQAISAGAGDAAASAELLDTANRVAIGGITQVTTAVDVLTTAQNAYAASGLRAEDAADALFVGMKAGKTTIDELSNSLGRAIPQATAVGFEFHELVAATAALTTQGQDTKLAVTGLSGIMTQLLKPSSQAVELAQQLGIEFTATKAATMGLAGFMEYLVDKTDGSQEALATLFGSVESLRAVFSLAGQGGVKFNEILEQMEGRAGAANEAYEKMAASLDQRLNVAMSKFGNMALTAGEASLNVLVPAMEGALEVTGFLSDNMDVLVTGGTAVAVLFGGQYAVSLGVTAVAATRAAVAESIRLQFALGATSRSAALGSIAAKGFGMAWRFALGPVGLAIAGVTALTAILVHQGREAERRAADVQRYADAAEAATEAARAARTRLDTFRRGIDGTGDSAREATGLINGFVDALELLSGGGLARLYNKAEEAIWSQHDAIKAVREEQSQLGMEGAALAEAQEAKAKELIGALYQQGRARDELTAAEAEQARLREAVRIAQYTHAEGRLTKELEAQTAIVDAARKTWAEYSSVVSALTSIPVDEWAGDTFEEQERAAAAASEALQDVITGLREQLVLARLTSEAERTIVENLQAAGLAANDNSAAAATIRTITQDILDLEKQRTKEERDRERAQNAATTIADLKREVDQLQRLTGALRLGEEAHRNVAEAILIEDMVRRNGLEGMDDEIARIKKLVHERGLLQRTYDGMAPGFDAANDDSEEEKVYAKERYDQLRDGLTDQIDNPALRLRQQFDEQLQIVRDYEEAYTGITAESLATREQLTRQFGEAQRDILISLSERAFGDLAAVMRDSAGEQSAAYKTMFALQQGFVIATAALNIADAMSDALAVGITPIEKMAAMAIVASNAAQIMASINAVTLGFAQGGYTGPGGVNDPAGVVHKGEVVWSQADVARYGGWQNVDAMRRGQMPANDSSSGRVSVDVNVTVDDEGRLQAYVARGMNEAVNASVQISDQRTKARMAENEREQSRPRISARSA